MAVPPFHAEAEVKTGLCAPLRSATRKRFGCKCVRFGIPFSRTDPVARFVLSVSMARNDIEHCARSAVEANEADRPEFGWWVRVANGFTFEAITAVRAWREESEEVRKYIDALPRYARRQLAKAVSVEQDIGGRAFEHIRQRKPSVRFLFTSGYNEVFINQKFELDPSFLFLRKPFSTLELATMLRGALEQQPAKTRAASASGLP